MPIFQHPTRGRVLFIHIPKTGGSSIEKWLQEAGFKLDKINHWAGDVNQHATRDVYEQWGEFDYKFAVVRHPLTRFVSTLGFRTIHAVDADNTAQSILSQYQRRPEAVTHWKSHLTPQVNYISDGVEVFRFEDDFFTDVSKALEIPGPFPHENKNKTTVQPSDLSQETHRQIIELYKADYQAFGYDDEIQT